MLCSSKPAEGGLNAVQRVRSTSQANNRALCNATSKAAKCLVGSGRRQEVNSQQTVNHIRALTKNTRCAPNVALANLNQLASKMQARQTCTNQARGGQRVQNQPHAFHLAVVGCLAQVNILCGSGTHNMLYSHRPQQMPLQAATCCGPHLATKGMDHLTSCQANASCGGMNQNRLSAVAWKSCSMAHGNINSHEDGHHSARFHKTRRLWDRNNKLLQGVSMRSQTARGQTSHPNANLQRIWSITHRRVPYTTHNTRHVTSWRTRVTWIRTKNIQDVPEVQSNSHHLQENHAFASHTRV